MADDIILSPHDIVEGAGILASIGRVVEVAITQKKIRSQDLAVLRESAERAKALRLRGYIREFADFRIEDMIELSEKINRSQKAGNLSGIALEEAYRVLEDYARDMERIKNDMMARIR